MYWRSWNYCCHCKSMSIFARIHSFETWACHSLWALLQCNYMHIVVLWRAYDTRERLFIFTDEEKTTRTRRNYYYERKKCEKSNKYFVWNEYQ